MKISVIKGGRKVLLQVSTGVPL